MGVGVGPCVWGSVRMFRSNGNMYKHKVTGKHKVHETHGGHHGWPGAKWTMLVYLESAIFVDESICGRAGWLIARCQVNALILQNLQFALQCGNAALVIVSLAQQAFALTLLLQCNARFAFLFVFVGFGDHLRFWHLFVQCWRRRYVIPQRMRRRLIVGERWEWGRMRLHYLELVARIRWLLGGKWSGHIGSGRRRRIIVGRRVVLSWLRY